MSTQRNLEFFLKLRKLIDEYKDVVNEDDKTMDFDEKWLSIRTPYFFFKDPESWDGYSFDATLGMLIRTNIGDHIDFMKDFLNSGYYIQNNFGEEVTIDDLFSMFDAFMDEIYTTRMNVINTANANEVMKLVMELKNIKDRHNQIKYLEVALQKRRVVDQLLQMFKNVPEMIEIINEAIDEINL